jgi:hypothetical protein
MTPTEKAYELYNKFLYIPFKNERFNAKDLEAKQCALIAVDEILNACKQEIVNTYFDDIYWLEVKKEIQKL